MVLYIWNNLDFYEILVSNLFFNFIYLFFNFIYLLLETSFLFFYNGGSFFFHNLIYTFPKNVTFIFGFKFTLFASFLIIMKGGVARYRYDYLTKLGWLKFISFTLVVFFFSLFFFFLF